MENSGLPPTPIEIYGEGIEEEVRGAPSIEELKLLTNNKGYPVVNTENVRRILERHPYLKDRFRKDMWTCKSEIYINGVWREIADVDIINQQNEIAGLYDPFRRVPKGMVDDAIQARLKECEFDSARDFFTNLVWDKEPRLDGWLSSVYGCPDDEYHRKIGSNWLKGAVKRVFLPGCKFDYVLCLIGDQGLGKSTSLKELGYHNWHTETSIRVGSKDMVLVLEGKMIVEFSEASTLSKSDDGDLKSFITNTKDTIRRPYARFTEDIYRRNVFALTANENEFLRFSEGSRRFWSAQIEQKANIDWIKENRDQLFAEAVYRVMHLKETVHEVPEEEARRIQIGRLIASPYEDMIVEWLNCPIIWGEGAGQKIINIDEEGLTISDVWNGALAGSKNRLTRREEMEIGRTLKRLGFEKQRRQVNGVRQMKWFNVCH